MRSQGSREKKKSPIYMHQVQITKVNRPMETVKLATPPAYLRAASRKKLTGQSPSSAVLGLSLIHI